MNSRNGMGDTGRVGRKTEDFRADQSREIVERYMSAYYSGNVEGARVFLAKDLYYAGLTDYFRAVRAAFSDRSIRRGIIVAEGEYIACQTWIEGTFRREFTHSPAGPIPPNGGRVVWDLSNIFRFDDQGRLVEEWVRTDYRSFLLQLGAPGR